MTEIEKILLRIRDIHNKKAADYASDSNRFSNFERMAEISSWFANDIDKSFANMVAVKLARLAELLNRVEPPKNESIDDSFLDLCTYCVLWMSYHESLIADDVSQKQ